MGHRVGDQWQQASSRVPHGADVIVAELSTLRATHGNTLRAEDRHSNIEVYNNDTGIPETFNNVKLTRYNARQCRGRRSGEGEPRGCEMERGTRVEQQQLTIYKGHASELSLC